MQFLLAWVGFSDDRSRADTATLSTRLSSIGHCAKVAEKAGIDRCLKYDMRPGSRSAVVLRKGLNAIIAAVFTDSRDFDKVLQVVPELGLFISRRTLFGHDEFGADLRLLSTDQAGVAEQLKVGFQEADTDPIPIEQLNQAPKHPNFHEGPKVYTDMQYTSMVHNDTFHGFSSLPQNRERDDQSTANAIKRPRLGSTGGTTERPDDNVAIRVTISLSEYLSEERERCMSHNIAPPDGTFFSEHIKKELRALGTKYTNTSILIHILIASPYAIATLRELVTPYQAAEDFHLWQVQPTVSAQARFNIIRRLDSKIAAYAILRRNHIFHLFEDSVPANSRALTPLPTQVLATFNRKRDQQKKRPGNPENNAKSKVTNRWAISKLQILGRRYYALVSRFQKGILSLLPPSGLAKPFDVGVPDNMILALPDAIFNKLLDILDRTQGDFPRSSEAAIRIIEPLIYHTPQSPGRFHIGTYEAEDILRHLKGPRSSLIFLIECIRCQNGLVSNNFLL
ncbi:hypothetical protein BDV10DRAFT_196464 [Aspergillus recurvatus]